MREKKKKTQKEEEESAARNPSSLFWGSSLGLVVSCSSLPFRSVRLSSIQTPVTHPPVAKQIQKRKN
jgi:hypothetical protein